jgi:hypothetical protein
MWIPIVCLTVTVAAVVWSIVNVKKYSFFSLLVAFMIPFFMFYILGKYQCNKVFIGTAIVVHCIFLFFLLKPVVKQ